MNLNDTKKDASGKWRGILMALGFNELQLQDKHGPCPMCEGKDRYRFTDYKGGGEYFCSGCGAGDGFDLVMGVKGWQFAEAAKEIDKLVGANNIPQVFKPKVDYEKRRKDLNNLWAGGFLLDGNHLDYLMHRKAATREMAESCKDLRGHPGMYYDREDYRPGMIALVRNKMGVPVSIHRTFYSPIHRKMMPPTEPIAGAAIRLGDKGSKKLVIGEGLETTLSGMQLYGGMGYSTISAHGMETVEIPRLYDHIIILADNDRSFTGQKAAFTLARRLDQSKQHVTVAMPAHSDHDFNDLRADDAVLEFINDQ